MIPTQVRALNPHPPSSLRPLLPSLQNLPFPLTPVNNTKGQASHFPNSDSRDIPELEEQMGLVFGRYLAASSHTENVSTNIAFRMSAIQSFVGDCLQPPKNMSWTYIIWDRFVYEKVATTFPDEFNLTYEAVQTIKSSVNVDLITCQ